VRDASGALRLVRLFVTVCLMHDTGADVTLTVSAHPLAAAGRWHKCPRCWRFTAEATDTLCGRCGTVVASLPSASA
jgi:hypothetical protein